MAHNQCVYCGEIMEHDNPNREDFCSAHCLYEAIKDDFENCGSYFDFAIEAGSY